MILSIIGAPAVGKSSLLKSVLSELDGEPEYIEPLKLFRCTKYNDILCLGQYNENEFSGTDSWSYSVLAKGKFENFIADQTKRFHRIIFEGDRLTSKVEWLTQNYPTKVFLLTISSEQEKIRQNLFNKILETPLFDTKGFSNDFCEALENMQKIIKIPVIFHYIVTSSKPSIFYISN